MTENNITDLFENQSPRSPKTPSKRRKSESFDENSANLNRDHQICVRNSKILVHDTPTPFMDRKSKKVINDDIAPYSQNQTGSSITITRRIIPNTPSVNNNNNKNNSSQISKKVKKLFDNNLLLLEEEELPGEEHNSNKPNLIQNKKVSSLFKPKSRANETNDASNLGCDLSLESLERRQKRRKNPLIARLSEIEPPSKLEKSNEIDENTETIGQEPSSPILTSKTNDLRCDFKQHKTPKFDEFQSPYFSNIRTPASFKLTTFNNLTSFTHVTEINIEETKRNDHRIDSILLKSPIEEQTENSTEQIQKENTLSETLNLNESDIDQILFDGLKIDENNFSNNNSKGKVINRSNKFGLVDKTNTSKTNKSKTNRSSSLVPSKNLSKKEDRTRNSRSCSNKSELYFPNKVKTFNISHMDLDERQLNKMKLVIKNLKKQYKYRDEIINSVFFNNFNSSITHIVIDFEKKFDGNTVISTNNKFMLILAALKECKIIRYEWLLHSEIKLKWNAEKKYLLESYIDQDLNELDKEEQNEFDIRLIKFIRNLKLTDRIDLFSKYGNIYISNNENSYDENENDTQNSFSDSFTSFKSKEKLYDYLHEVITRCNGLITSRVACADLILAIDKADDYDSSEHGKACLKQVAICLKSSLDEIKNKLTNCKIRKKIPVVSSNWVLDTVLDNCEKKQGDYTIFLLNGEIFISTNLNILAKKPEHENQECSIKKAELIIENQLSNFISKIESLEKTNNNQKSSFKFKQQNIANMKSALECTHESVNQLTLDIDSVNQRTEKIFSSLLEIKKDILDSNLKLNEEISKIHNFFLTNGTLKSEVQAPASKLYKFFGTYDFFFFPIKLLLLEYNVILFDGTLSKWSVIGLSPRLNK
ncbi:unnamed protein product [Brachionus calyciflorus]|uniref:BRCT domain-containing protein n=1 Tax=Brachionus calyciflorus TaxID=104777 RepID=A0A813ZKV5_9BILA|nr:unnamed protein product [Brachionus calyciflorus]